MVKEIYAADTEKGTVIGLFSSKEVALEEMTKERLGWKETMNSNGFFVTLLDPEEMEGGKVIALIASASKGAKQTAFIVRIRPLITDLDLKEIPNVSLA